MPQLLTVDEVAERLRCDTRKVYRLLSEGAFPSLVVGGRRLVSEATLSVYLAQLETLPYEPTPQGAAGRRANRTRAS
jgi:excisionase family DNA binding protein